MDVQHVDTPSPYRRVLLKLSGEALMGDGNFGIDPQVVKNLAADIHVISQQHGVQLGIVVGGGNIFRGVSLTEIGINRVSGDYMGMLATVMNGIALQDALQKVGVPARVMSALTMDKVAETYDHRVAMRHLAAQRVVIFTAGTGNPFFTTDSAASLRAIEINADLLIKATKVDGVYSADPIKHPDAKRYPRLSYDTVLKQELGVMDLTAIVLCRDHGLPLRVLNMNKAGALLRAVRGEDEGTLVHNEE